MRQNSLRRLGALVLALALALTLAPPAWAAPGDLTITGPAELEIGSTIRLAAAWGPSAAPTAQVTYTWGCTPAGAVGFTTPDATGAVTVSARSNTAQNVEITLTAEWNDGTGDKTETATPTHRLALKEAAPTVSITPPASTTLGLGESVTLQAVPSNLPAGTTPTYVWEAAPTDGITIVQSGSSRCTVTAAAERTYTVKVTMRVGESAYESAPLELTWKRQAVERLSFNTTSAKVVGKDDPNPWDLTVYTTPAGADLGSGIVWEIRNKDAADSRVILELPKGAGGGDGSTYTGGKTVRLTNAAPGEATVYARYGSLQATQDVIVSGIVLSAEKATMYVGDTRTLSVAKPYGFAASGSPTDVVWTSSDPSTVTVVNGELQAWKLGTVIITANKNGYTATCEVKVTEDQQAVIDGQTATISQPLTFDGLYEQINEISILKTQRLNADGTVAEAGSPLNYITNVTVPTSQGTLYYNYDSESNTGAGVGGTDRFAYQRTASILQTLDKLCFVPRQGFGGTAEITFVGWSLNGTAFPITVKVEVKELDGVRYKTSSGEPAFFLGSDFNSYCRARMGRDLSYVTFNLPQSSQGGLYYGYTSAGQYEGRVTTGTQYGRSGRYTIDDVCFIPNDAFVGEVSISFRCVDTAGRSFTGEVVINVTAPTGLREGANVFMTGQWGEPLALEPGRFNTACQAAIGDTLSYVRLQLPAYDQGVLYYDYRGAGSYGSRVASTTRYYYSGSPGISGVTFVPASNGSGRVSIRYTGYGVGGTSYTGTLYITLGEQERTTVHYSVRKGEQVTFRADDFNNTALLQMGADMEYVQFQFPDEMTIGSLYYDYKEDAYNYPPISNIPYYREPEQLWQGALDGISFHAKNTAGSVNIPFTAYTAADSEGARRSADGILLLQVGAVSPADVNLSGRTSERIGLTCDELSRTCATVMDDSLSYIQITSLPSPEQGRLYYSYNGFKTGVEVRSGDRYYCEGSPAIDQLSFVPRGGYSGQAVITYIGYSNSGKEQVSGRIVLEITRSTTSQIFNDMERHGWAVDAVEFLYRNRTIEGVGDGRFNPTGLISKGDFTLMLVRAFGFTGAGSTRYTDVPEDSYYAQAIKTATRLGIVQGSDGKFEPRKPLTRQEAMKMIYLALKADGSPLSNGLTADFTVFQDRREIDPDAREAIGALMLLGIVRGNGDGTLNPRGTLNRAETASLMHGLMTL